MTITYIVKMDEKSMKIGENSCNWVKNLGGVFMLADKGGKGFDNMRAARSAGLCHSKWMRSAILLLWLASVLLAQPAQGGPGVLVYQRNGKGFVHDNIAASAAAIRELGIQHGFDVEVTTNAGVFTDENLKKYAAIVFANSNNEAFENGEQRASFEKYIRGGGGFVGVHSSTGSERQWDFFQTTQGGKFFRHSPMQTFTAQVVDPTDSSTAHLGRRWVRTDECYFFKGLNPKVHVLLAAEIATLKDAKLNTTPGDSVGGLFPLAWRIESEGSRRFYTSLGHKIEHYSDPEFRQHLAGGILWVLGNRNSTVGTQSFTERK